MPIPGRISLAGFGTERRLFERLTDPQTDGSTGRPDPTPGVTKAAWQRACILFVK